MVAFRACVLLAVVMCCATAGAQTFTRVADTSTPIPGGSGAFSSFDPSVVAASFFPITREVSFRGFGDGQEGIYYYEPSGGLVRIADRNTAMPGTTGKFESFDTPSGAGTPVFRASGAGRHGIYWSDSNGIAQAIDSAPAAQGSFGRVSKGYPVAANAYLRNGAVVSNGGAGSINFTPSGFTLVEPNGDPDVGVFDVFVRAQYIGPGAGTGIFMGGNNFPAPARVIDGGPGQIDNVSAGLGGTVAAIVRSGPNAGLNFAFPRGTSRGEPYESVVLVAPGDPMPSGRGTFTNFRSVAAGGLENVVPSKILGAFLAEGAPGEEGIYWIDRSQQFHTLIERGDMLDGRIIDHLDLGRDGASAEVVAFHATFTDGSAGIYYAIIPEPTAAGLVGAFLCLAGMQRRRRIG